MRNLHNSVLLLVEIGADGEVGNETQSTPEVASRRNRISQGQILASACNEDRHEYFGIQRRNSQEKQPREEAPSSLLRRLS